MTNLVSPERTFHDGNTIPQLGYGVWKVEDIVAADVVQQALASATATSTPPPSTETKRAWGAMAATEIPRDEMFITTKVWNEARVSRLPLRPRRLHGAPRSGLPRPVPDPLAQPKQGNSSTPGAD